MASKKIKELCETLGKMLGAAVITNLPGIIEKQGDEKRILKLIDRNGGRLQFALGLYSTEGIGDAAKLAALIPRQQSSITIDPGVLSGRKPETAPETAPEPEGNTPAPAADE